MKRAGDALQRLQAVMFLPDGREDAPPNRASHGAVGDTAGCYAQDPGLRKNTPVFLKHRQKTTALDPPRSSAVTYPTTAALSPPDRAAGPSRSVDPPRSNAVTYPTTK